MTYPFKKAQYKSFLEDTAIGATGLPVRAKDKYYELLYTRAMREELKEQEELAKKETSEVTKLIETLSKKVDQLTEENEKLKKRKRDEDVEENIFFPDKKKKDPSVIMEKVDIRGPNTGVSSDDYLRLAQNAVKRLE